MVMPVEIPQVNVARSAAGRAAGSNSGHDGGADRGREQHRHLLGLGSGDL
jgi:hypothetical protein